MTKTKYYDLQMDDPQDDYDVEVVNANLKKIDEQMKTRENATDALQEPEFTVAEKRENIASKEKMPKILGKIAKFFTDLKTVAFSGKYSDLDGKPAIVNNNTATEAGSALDARQANPTIEGTMANQILQLNSDLSDLSSDINSNIILNSYKNTKYGVNYLAIQNSVLHPRRITKIVSIKFPVSKESGIAWTIFDVCIATSNYGCFTISLFATYEHNTGIVKKLFVNKNNIPDAVKNIFCISYGNEGSSPKIWITNTSNEAINWDYCFIIIKNVITTGSSYDGDSFILSLDDSIIGNVSGTTTL